MFICHLLHKSVHFFLQNKSTLVNMTDATDHIVYYMQEAKLHFQTVTKLKALWHWQQKSACQLQMYKFSLY